MTNPMNKPRAAAGGDFERIRPDLVAAAFAAFAGDGGGMRLVRAIARDDFKLRLDDRQADQVRRQVAELMNR